MTGLWTNSKKLNYNFKIVKITKSKMKIKIALILLGLVCSLKSYSSNGEEPKMAKKQPNVIIILTDDMGYGEISCYNKNQVATPHIDRLAKEGARFTDFYVPTPYCAPSRASLLTGRFPLRHGMVENPAPDAGINDIGLNTSEITMGEYFQEAGYKTKGIGKWHLGHKPEFSPLKHGFDEYFGMLYSNDMRPVNLVENNQVVEEKVDQRLLTQKYTAKALDFIEQNKKKPFFLYLAHAMPHKPLAASADFYKTGSNKELYESVIRELDWSTGAIISKLEKLNLLENTIVIFMSDNGPWYGGNTNGLKGMKATNWEGGIRVPFIIRYPKEFPKGKTITTPCWSLDILPSLMEVCKIKTNADIKLDGQNICQIIQGKSTVHAPIFSMRDTKIRTIRDGKWKLFVAPADFYKEVDLNKWSDPRAPDGTSIIAPLEQASPKDYPGLKPNKIQGEVLLFDLEKDPAETKNLANDYPEIKEKLMQEYQNFLNSLPKI
jgi:arylsulfatase A-like enzyme